MQEPARMALSWLRASAERCGIHLAFHRGRHPSARAVGRSAEGGGVGQDHNGRRAGVRVHRARGARPKKVVSTGSWRIPDSMRSSPGLAVWRPPAPEVSGSGGGRPDAVSAVSRQAGDGGEEAAAGRSLISVPC